ncbi:hypothetical protein MalM25_04620 [Planctomycetes bacterium MalM25]|nr:hypothetical protein MalM25_04620 [Planctomycetes bacterium MalM25]
MQVHDHVLLGRRPAMLLMLVGCLASPAVGQTVANRKPTLEERLTSGLLARRPSEIAYIAAVIDTVNRGDLPTKLVDRVFLWARSKAPKNAVGRRPITYFQAGLDRIAAKMRINIEADRPATTSSGG